MGLFDDLVGGFFGQSEKPNFQNPSPQDVLSQIISASPQIADATVAYNQRLAGPLAQLQRQVEDIYDPNQGKLREQTTQSILQQLGLGGKLPQDVIQSVTQSGLEQGQAAGIGKGIAGRNLVAKDLGLTSLDLLNNRINTAASYTRSAPTPNQLFQPQSLGIDPGSYGNLVLGNANTQNAQAQYNSQINSQNRANIFQTPLNNLTKVAGIAGAFAGI